MNRTGKKIVACICLLSILTCCQDIFSNTIYVGKRKGFATISAAVNASKDGDTILVSKGIYKEGILLLANEFAC